MFSLIGPIMPNTLGISRLIGQIALPQPVSAYNLEGVVKPFGCQLKRFTINLDQFASL